MVPQCWLTLISTSFFDMGGIIYIINNRNAIMMPKRVYKAYEAYKEAKVGYLKELAEKWKDKIDDRAYQALLNYDVYCGEKIND